MTRWTEAHEAALRRARGEPVATTRSPADSGPGSEFAKARANAERLGVLRPIDASAAESVREEYNRARQRTREAAGAAVLTADQVRRIRVEIADGSKRPALATKYGVSRATIGQIVRGMSWKHLQ